MLGAGTGSDDAQRKKATAVALSDSPSYGQSLASLKMPFQHRSLEGSIAPARAKPHRIRALEGRN